METQKPFSTQMIELLNALLDKIEPALKSGRITPEERESIATLLTRVQTLEGREIPTAYDDTELRGKITTLEQREDKVGVSAEEMGRAISAAIAALPPDQVGISEERVQELLAAIHTYDDSELRRLTTTINLQTQQIDADVRRLKSSNTAQQQSLNALSAIPAGFDELKQRIQQLEISSAGANGGTSPEDTAELTRRIEQLERASAEQLNHLSHRLEEAERKNQVLAYTASEFEQVKAFVTNLAQSMRYMQDVRPEEIGRKIESYINGAISEASQHSAGAAFIFN